MSGVARVDLSLEELAAKILGACGKDSARVAGILARGSLVSGDSRLRWRPLEAMPDDVEALLARFPDHDPARPFERSRCVRMEFRSARATLEIVREVGLRKRLLRRKAFWDEALAVIARLGPRCQDYSYSEQVDMFAASLTQEARSEIRALGPLIRYSPVAAKFRALDARTVMLFLTRG